MTSDAWGCQAVQPNAAARFNETAARRRQINAVASDGACARTRAMHAAWNEEMSVRRAARLRRTHETTRDTKEARGRAFSSRLIMTGA